MIIFFKIGLAKTTIITRNHFRTAPVDGARGEVTALEPDTS